MIGCAVALLVIPWPLGIRRWLVQNVASSYLMGLLFKPLMYFFALVCFTFVFSASAMVRLNSGYHEACQRELQSRLQHESHMFMAQVAPLGLGMGLVRHAPSNSRRVACCSETSAW